MNSTNIIDFESHHTNYLKVNYLWTNKRCKISAFSSSVDRALSVDSGGPGFDPRTAKWKPHLRKFSLSVIPFFPCPVNETWWKFETPVLILKTIPYTIYITWVEMNKKTISGTKTLLEAMFIWPWPSLFHKPLFCFPG